MKTFWTNESFRYLVAYYAKYWHRLAAGTACLLAANVLALASPSILRHVIDGLIANISRSWLLAFGGALLLLALAQATLLFFQRRLLIGAARDVEFNLRNDFYAHLQKLAPEFYQRRRTGDLMARATSDTAAIRMLGGLGLISTLNAVFAVTMVLPVMIVVNWKLTAVAFLPLPLLALISHAFSKRIHNQARTTQESYGRLSSVAQEMPTGVRVVRAYRQEQESGVHSQQRLTHSTFIRFSFAPAILCRTRFCDRLCLWWLPGPEWSYHDGPVCAADALSQLHG